MNELIKITEKDGQRVVSARELYPKLGLDKTHYSRWYKKNIINNDFLTEHEDYEGFAIVANGNKTMDFALTIDTAKELSMLARTKEGKQVRKYFIEQEKIAKSVVAVPMSKEEMRLHVMQGLLADVAAKDAQIENQAKQIEEKDKVIIDNAPKVSFYDKVINAKGTMTISEVAKGFDLKSGYELNKILHENKVQYKSGSMWMLYSNHCGNGYTSTRTTPVPRSDGSTEIKVNTVWTQKGRRFIFDILIKKGIINPFPNVNLSDNSLPPTQGQLPFQSNNPPQGTTNSI